MFGTSSAEQARFLATVFLVLACLTLNWANILTFNFTVICMHPDEAEVADVSKNVIMSQTTNNKSEESTESSGSSSSSMEQLFLPGDNIHAGMALERRRKRSNSNSSSSSDHHKSIGNLSAVVVPLRNANAVVGQQQQQIPRYQFSSTQRSQAMSVVALGALIANFPVVVLINWHGPRVPFALLGLLGAAATVAIPFCLEMGFYWFLIARFFQGVAFAGDMATFGHFLANWTDHKRYAFLTASLALYVQLAPFLTFPAAGLLCSSSIGWPGVYYVHAIVTLATFTAFGAFYRNRGFMPGGQQHIAPTESTTALKEREECNNNGSSSSSCANLNQIAQEAERPEQKRMEKLAKRNIPLREILMSKAVWAIFLSAVGDFTAVNLLYQFTPIYLYAVQGFKVMETGMMATVPPLVQAITKECAGFLNDQIPRTLLTETAKTRVFNSIALFSTAAFLFALAAVPRGHGFAALGLISAGEALLGFIVGGFYKSGPQLAGIYGPFVMGQVSTALTLTMLVVPFVVSQITYDNTSGEWALAFCFVAIICIVCNCVYIAFAKTTPEYWATMEYFRQRMLVEQNKENDARRRTTTATTTKNNDGKVQKEKK